MHVLDGRVPVHEARSCSCAETQCHVPPRGEGCVGPTTYGSRQLEEWATDIHPTCRCRPTDPLPSARRRPSPSQPVKSTVRAVAVIGLTDPDLAFRDRADRDLRAFDQQSRVAGAYCYVPAPSEPGGPFVTAPGSSSPRGRAGSLRSATGAGLLAVWGTAVAVGGDRLEH